MKDYCHCSFCRSQCCISDKWTKTKQKDDVEVLKVKPYMMHQSREALLDTIHGSDVGSDGPEQPDDIYLLSGPSPPTCRKSEKASSPVDILRVKERQRNMVLPMRQSTQTRDPFPELSNSPMTPTTANIMMDTSARSTPSSSPPRYPGDLSLGFRSHPVSRSGSGYDLHSGTKSISGYDLQSVAKSPSSYHHDHDNDGYMRGSELEMNAHRDITDYDDDPNWTPSSYNKQLLFFYMEDDNYRPLVVGNTMQACDVCHNLVEKNHVRDDINWVIVEHNTKFNIERLVEDHEMIHTIQRHWAEPEDCRFYFRKDFRKFEPFRNPGNFIPIDAVDQCQLKDAEVGDLLPATERYNHMLLQHLFNFDHLPDIQSQCFIKDSKKGWKKVHTILKPTGLFHSKQGTSKDSKHLMSLFQLSEVDIYIALDSKKMFSSPHPHCLCLKRPQVTDIKDMFLICMEDEKTLLCLYTVLRLVKFGSRLKENYKVAVNYLEKAILREHDFLASEDQVKQRVAMDFTGTRGRVVDDPNEALGVACEEAQRWRKKVTVRKVMANQLEGDVAPPSFLTNNNIIQQQYTQGLCAGVHMVSPWFHSGISRQETVDLITKHGLVDGVFLVRESQSISGIHVLSLAHNHKVKHCQIHTIEIDGQQYHTLDSGHTKFTDLVQLVDFYQLNAAGLPCRLTHYVTRLV